VEEKKNDRDPTQENKIGEKFQEVIVNCLHDAKVVVQHILKWQDMSHNHITIILGRGIRGP
jgi:hypothetical protein